jgi:hypothetical protein
MYKVEMTGCLKNHPVENNPKSCVKIYQEISRPGSISKDKVLLST